MALVVAKQWTTDVPLRMLFGVGRFGWCSDGFHANCRRSYNPRYSNTTRYCQCSDDNCECRNNPRENADA